MADRARYVLGLIDHAGTNRACIDLDEADHVRMLCTDEVGDTRQHLAVTAQVPGARDGEVEGRTGTCGVANVIDEQTHVSGSLSQTTHSIAAAQGTGEQTCRRTASAV